MTKVQNYISPLQSFKIVPPILFFQRETSHLFGSKSIQNILLTVKKSHKVFNKLRSLVFQRKNKVGPYDGKSATLQTEMRGFALQPSKYLFTFSLEINLT